MLLVPGLAITNAIRDTIAGDLVSGLTRAAEAFFIAISIAVGTGAGIKYLHEISRRYLRCYYVCLLFHL